MGLEGLISERANTQPQQQQQQQKIRCGKKQQQMSLSLSLAPCPHVYSFEYAVIRFFMALNVSLSRLFSGSFFFLFLWLVCA